MKQSLERFGSFPAAVRVLLVSQFTINTGFFVLYPYLPGHMTHDLGLNTSLIDLVLGAGTLSQ